MKSRRRRSELLEALVRIEKQLKGLAEDLRKSVTYNEAARKLSEAGKKSAEARKMKFGSAKPVSGTTPKVIIVDDPLPTNLLGEPVRQGEFVKTTETHFQYSLGGDGSAGSQGRSEPKKRSTKSPTPGSQLWGVYERVYRLRWKIEPMRNAKVNRQLSEIVAQAGLTEAVKLVEYYLTRNDAVYLNAKHPVGLLLMHLQKLRTEMLTRSAMTMREANRAEAHQQTDEAIRQYADSESVS